MKFSDKVLKHPIFLKFIKEIKDMENGRSYCHHELEHAVDVARLAWIYYLEDTLAVDAPNVTELHRKWESSGVWTDEIETKKDLFYTAALLHDIGRGVQYQTGVHHSVSGLEPAKQILEDVEIPKDWEKQILDVIAEHADDNMDRLEKDLEYYIAKADHDSRLCFACEVRESCKWTEDEMNNTVVS